jgi:hypothetical protein
MGLAEYKASVDQVTIKVVLYLTGVCYRSWRTDVIMLTTVFLQCPLEDSQRLDCWPHNSSSQVCVCICHIFVALFLYVDDEIFSLKFNVAFWRLRWWVNSALRERCIATVSYTVHHFYWAYNLISLAWSHVSCRILLSCTWWKFNCAKAYNSNSLPISAIIHKIGLAWEYMESPDLQHLMAEMV